MNKTRCIFFALLLAALMMSACPASAIVSAVPPQDDASPFYEEMPYFLRFTQKTESEEAARDVYIQRVYPDTMNDEVDAAMRSLIDDMAARNTQYLPLERGSIPSCLDVGAVISRTGTSVLSFLTLAEVSREKEQLSVDFETRVYDIETGKALTLDDLFLPDSGFYALLAENIRAQLSAAFPTETADQQALDRLCSKEGMRSAAFTLGAGRITFSYRADTLYPGRNTLLHVHLYYPDVRGMMTGYGQRQTDNARFKMVALTYDDGGARASTRRVLDVLRNHGAQATFFIVGRTMRNSHDLLSRQQDSAYSIQSHTYTHDYPDELTGEEAHRQKKMFIDEINQITGVPPTMMRSPGGRDSFYVVKDIGYPIIHWSLASGDSGSTNATPVANRVIYAVNDGDIVLMHDANSMAHVYSRYILENLTRRGFLCVTVEELFARDGVALENNVVYFSPQRIGE